MDYTNYQGQGHGQQGIHHTMDQPGKIGISVFASNIFQYNRSQRKFQI
jgi:hypothetical protein